MSFFHSKFFQNRTGTVRKTVVGTILKTIIGTIIGMMAGLALIFILFVTAFEIACYSDYGFYEKEYKKYDVNNEHSIVNMEMDELMRVTKEMMSYLRGDRENLVIYAQIDGTEKEMFNEIDKSHMADVRELFTGALALRRICICIFAFCCLLLIVASNVRYALMFLCSKIQFFIGTLWILLFFIVIAAYINFNAVFTAMHLLLFDNDNWLLDPDISRLINILPEGFFMDMGVRIAVLFVIINIIIFFLCFLGKRGMIKRRKNKLKISGGTYEQG